MEKLSLAGKEFRWVSVVWYSFGVQENDTFSKVCKIQILEHHTFSIFKFIPPYKIMKVKVTEIFKFQNN